MARIRTYIVPDKDYIDTYKAVLRVVNHAGKINAIDMGAGAGRNFLCVYATEKQHAQIDDIVFNLYINGKE